MPPTIPDSPVSPVDALDGVSLPVAVRPTGEKRPNYGATKEPRPGSSRLRDLVLKSRYLFYRHDKLEAGQTRILILEPATEINADVYIEIHTVDFEYLKKNRSWQALSYHWGEHEEGEPVYVRNALKTMREAVYLRLAVGTRKDEVPDDSGPLIPSVRVKGNLYNALKNMRQIGPLGKTQKIALWADGICINQGDSAERTQQVANMANLYAAANRVCVWLGARDNHGRRFDAMEFVKEIVSEWSLEQLVREEKAQRWINFVFLLRSSWFSRRWTIQELALAEDVIVQCGDCQIHWKDFADAIGFFTFYLGEIKEIARKAEGRLSANEKNDLRVLTDLDVPQATKLVDEIANAFRKHPNGKLLEPAKGLETLVSTLTAFDSSDPRDTIFALLNIAKETSTTLPNSRKNLAPLRPDYTQDTLKVFVDFLDWVIRSRNSLDILCRQWALPEERQPINPPLPSWINRKPSDKKNAKSFVGLPGATFYNASRNKLPDVKFGINEIEEIRKRDAVMQTHAKEDLRRTQSRLDGQAVDVVAQHYVNKRSYSMSGPSQPNGPSLKKARSHLSEGVGSTETSKPQHAGNNYREGYSDSTGADTRPAVTLDIEGANATTTVSFTNTGDANADGEAMELSGAAAVAPSDCQPIETTPRSPVQPLSPAPTDTRSNPLQGSALKNSMFVKGLIVGQITWTTFFPDGVITQTALEKLGWRSEKEEISHYDVPEKVWRTLVADRGPTGDQPPNWYHKACLQCLTQETPNGHMNLKEMLRDEAASGRTMKRQFIERVEAATWERAIIAVDNEESRGDPLVGLGPKGTQSGDIVCILFGCSVPCILRQQRMDDERPSYRFIGESFVYGKMEGQALEDFESGSEEPTEFRIT